MSYFIVRLSTGQYITDIKMTSKYTNYKLTNDREAATRLIDFDAKLLVSRLRTKGLTAEREPVDGPLPDK